MPDAELVLLWSKSVKGDKNSTVIRLAQKVYLVMHARSIQTEFEISAAATAAAAAALLSVLYCTVP